MTRTGARGPMPSAAPPPARRGRRRPPREAPRERPRRPTRSDYRRRRLAALLIGLVLIVGLGLGGRVLLYDAGLFDVEDVAVAGTTTIAVEDVLAVAAVEMRRPLAEVDTGAVATRVATLPAVASVQVGRSWPHTVAIDVVERIPVARVQTVDGESLVDTRGVVYRGVVPVELPRLTLGIAGPDDPATQAAIGALVALPPPLRAQVLTVDVAVAATGAPGQVTFGLTEDRLVRWGAPDRAADKSTALAALLTQPGKVYDVTSPELPTIRR
ncbi:cell division protein FtsQ/DivIB [Pseudonocardia sp. TRM90224]|uniref:cell division protein FtsQ/DivIB n=1 Tax=Pseudonocardia sp. TRM90224 TaxID=2812678 RepID=UPI001E37106A|nr:FtsQ-type POTRA domain-containing protein [Pseudonocardia sp. TRM90224]